MCDCVCMYVCVHVEVRSQFFKGQFTSSTMWVPGITLGPLGLEGRAFLHWGSLPFLNCTLTFKKHFQTTLPVSLLNMFCEVGFSPGCHSIFQVRTLKLCKVTGLGQGHTAGHPGLSWGPPWAANGKTLADFGYGSSLSLFSVSSLGTASFWSLVFQVSCQLFLEFS